MVFSDLFFIFGFIPGFALLYLLATWMDKRVLRPGEDGRPQFHLRNAALVVFSLLFYAWGEPIYVLLMLVCVFINYVTGLGIARNDRKRRRKAWLIVGLTLDLILIGTFKYLGFFAEALAPLGLDLNVPKLALPIGISFYTFQSITYLVDVYRGEEPAQRRYRDLLLYIAMFPQLIAGPIVRYGTVARELHSRHIDVKDFAEGAYRFFIGLGKKVVLANILSEVSTHFLVDSIDHLSVWGAWIGIGAFALQIYFDFSGYSDMAIGLGRCMGFHFCENFQHPYCCDSVTDFWRRWHTSLGTFFRDYVYIPMGGNRRRQLLNILTVWFLTGMWHGASWNFIIWGLYFGLALVIEKIIIFPVRRFIPRILMRVYALAIVIVGWGCFYFDNFDKMRTFFVSAFGQASLEFGLDERVALTDNFWIWVGAIILCTPLRRYVERGTEAVLTHASPSGGAVVMSASRAIISVLILALCVSLLVGATNNAFIYTRF